MSARLAGAVLAMVAIALLAATIATSALWSGSPEVNGRTIERKSVYVGLLGAEGCNTGGDGMCKDIPMGGLLPTISLVALGAAALLVLVLVGLAVTAFTNREGRKVFAKLAMIGAVLVGATAGAMLAVGPTFLREDDLSKVLAIKVPLGFGLILMFGAVLTTFVAAALAPKEDPPRRLRPSRQPIQQFAPPPQLDVASMFPAEPPLPMHAPAPPFSPAPSAPYARQSSSHPSQPPPPQPPPPQLRPLYDAAPAQGGTGGYVPTPPPIQRPPTTLPHSAPDLRAQTTLEPELPTPPPSPPPPSGSRTKAASIVPPPRVKAPSLPPARGKPASVAPPAFSFPKNSPFTTSPVGTAPSLPGLPPPAKIATGFDALPNTGPFAAPLGPYASAASGLMPPVIPSAGPGSRLPTPRNSPTTVTPVVPPPSGLAPPPKSAYVMPVRAETDPGEDLETRQLDSKERPSTSAGLGVGEPAQVGDSTDAMFAPSTEINKQIQRADSESDVAETKAVEKYDLASLEGVGGNEEPTTPVDPLAVAKLPRPFAPPTDDQDEKPTRPVRHGERPVVATKPESALVEPSEPKVEITDPELIAKLPVTTAPADLAPPREEKAVAAGPSPACPQCEAPMTWVEEHLRFYCKSCRMYF